MFEFIFGGGNTSLSDKDVIGAGNTPSSITILNKDEYDKLQEEIKNDENIIRNCEDYITRYDINALECKIKGICEKINISDELINISCDDNKICSINNVINYVVLRKEELVKKKKELEDMKNNKIKPDTNPIAINNYVVKEPDFAVPDGNFS